jgi:hypothetical protein
VVVKTTGQGQGAELSELSKLSELSELSFSSTKPPLATIAADHRLPPIIIGSPGPAGKQQARHGRKGGQEKRPAARRTTAPRNTHKHLIRTSDGDRRCAKAAAACRQAQVEWSWRGGKMRGGKMRGGKMRGGKMRGGDKRERCAALWRAASRYSPMRRLPPRACRAPARAGPGGLPRLYKQPGKPWSRV